MHKRTKKKLKKIKKITFRLIIKIKKDKISFYLVGLSWFLIVYGGMYFDSNVIILRSFDPLRKYNLVKGREQQFTTASGILIAKPWSLFGRLHLDAYSQQFQREKFFVHALMIIPNLINWLSPENI